MNLPHIDSKVRQARRCGRSQDAGPLAGRWAGGQVGCKLHIDSGPRWGDGPMIATRPMAHRRAPHRIYGPCPRREEVTILGPPSVYPLPLPRPEWWVQTWVGPRMAPTRRGMPRREADAVSAARRQDRPQRPATRSPLSVGGARGPVGPRCYPSSRPQRW